MGTLSIVATPIGNLADITFRAVETLKAADMIACEDTRVTAKLLQRFEIKKPLLIYSAQNRTSVARIEKALEEGKHIALVTDAGTPGISDPGAELVADIREKLTDEITIEAIPGPAAVMAALSIAGLPCAEFTFVGFLPHKKGRETLFKEIAESERTIVFYESPHRIEKALASLAQTLGPGRRVATCRELTKVHESVVRGSAPELVQYFTDHPDQVRGEFVVIVAP
jgi:16S rRNA (cytidine1402-2'-O)-methyltransferase